MLLPPLADPAPAVLRTALPDAVDLLENLPGLPLSALDLALDDQEPLRVDVPKVPAIVETDQRLVFQERLG